MAITASGLYVVSVIKQWDGTDVVFDWTNDTIKAALYTNSLTPNFSTDVGYGAAPYTSNEIANGNGYTTAGKDLASKTVTESPTGTVMWDCADLAWTASTFSAVRGMLVYDDTIASKRAIVFVNFGADYAVTSGTFTVQIAATGLFTHDVTP